MGKAMGKIGEDYRKILSKSLFRIFLIHFRFTESALSNLSKIEYFTHFWKNIFNVFK